MNNLTSTTEKLRNKYIKIIKFKLKNLKKQNLSYESIIEQINNYINNIIKEIDNNNKYTEAKKMKLKLKLNHSIEWICWELKYIENWYITPKLIHYNFN